MARKLGTSAYYAVGGVGLERARGSGGTSIGKGSQEGRGFLEVGLFTSQNRQNQAGEPEWHLGLGASPGWREETWGRNSGYVLACWEPLCGEWGPTAQS